MTPTTKVVPHQFALAGTVGTTYTEGGTMNEGKSTPVCAPIDEAETFTTAALQMLRYGETTQARRLLVRALEFLDGP